MTPRLRLSAFRKNTTVLTLDYGALIGFEAGSKRVQALVERLIATGQRMAVPVGAIARAWQALPEQHRMQRLIEGGSVDIVPFDYTVAKAAGALCARYGTLDVVDASVVYCAFERGHRAIVTTNPDRLGKLAPGIRLLHP